MKFLLLGAAGQLGHELRSVLEGEVVGLTRAEVDVTVPESLEQAIRQHRPDFVVNCAAYNLVDKAEKEPEAALRVNAWAVRDLAALCASSDVGLVHISTDYVFGLAENHGSPYEEADAPGPLGIYGLSKLSGEYLARSGCRRHFVVRTCGLYGLWGSNFGRTPSIWAYDAT